MLHLATRIPPTYRPGFRAFATSKSKMQLASPVVQADWLSKNLTNVKIIDASWYLPQMKRDTRAEYLKQRIPGAVFFDIDEVSDKSVALPHMLPPKELFETSVSNLGISNGDAVVVYDTAGILSSPRVWWTFRIFGHDNVGVLNGGLPKWLEAKLPTESGEPKKPQKGQFKASYRRELIYDLRDVERNEKQMVDARPAGRFKGVEPEPRPNLVMGRIIFISAHINIPNSINIPQGTLLQDGKLLPPEKLQEVFTTANVDVSKPFVSLCGSGVNACTVALAAYVLGNPKVAIYDGSWTEYGAMKPVRWEAPPAEY